MTEYVLCYAHPLPHVFWPEVLLIEKKKPTWQAGRYNLPGGHVEEGETPHEAAARELREETGIEASDVKLMGTFEGPGFVVYCMLCEYDSLRGKNQIKTLTNEHVFWMPLGEVFRSQLLIPNLRYVISFIRAGYQGWTLNEINNNPAGDNWIVEHRETADAVA